MSSDAFQKGATAGLSSSACPRNTAGQASSGTQTVAVTKAPYGVDLKAISESLSSKFSSGPAHPICLSPSAIPIRLTRIAGIKAAVNPTASDTANITRMVEEETSNTGRKLSNCF